MKAASANGTFTSRITQALEKVPATDRYGPQRAELLKKFDKARPIGTRLVVRLAAGVFCLGTMASTFGELFRRRVKLETKTEEPGGVQVLSIDGDTPDGIPPQYFCQLQNGAQGVEGFGLNPGRMGIEIVERNYVHIRSAVEKSLELLLRGGPVLRPLIQPHSCVRAVWVYGPGGVSTSMSTIIERVTSEAIRKLGISAVHIDHFLIGPDICCNATDRSVAGYQRAWIKSNHAQELQTLLDWFANAPTEGAGGSEIQRSVSLIDSKNLAGVSISRMNDFAAMASDALFHFTTTIAGKEFRARLIDAIGTGQQAGPPSSSNNE